MAKNRVPTMKELEALHRMIRASEKRLADLNAEIDTVRAEADGYHATLKELNPLLQIAKVVQSSAELTLSSVENGQFDQVWKSLDKEGDPHSCTPHPSQSQIHAIGKKFRESHEAHQRLAQSTLKEAFIQVAQAEEDIDVNETLLSCAEQALSSLINLREETKDQIKRMKGLIRASRRVPDELWLQIFEERINEDENHYMRGKREE
ncbi:9064_t:CDS:1 [Acaulospora colombiana]|uniref:9064_t:CDS:1 n=1 Tax=Acaulospora colombiana TaxID=27376 RepID=A0ACA9Q183_9GLOM|nr:9064_t:CDS:1 [Acaulospora colombiana]